VVNLSAEIQKVSLPIITGSYYPLYGNIDIKESNLELKPYGIGVWSIR